jgi:hypothetical protein
MAGIFPDSGVTPNNAANAVTPDVALGCDPLFYSSTRCNPRFDPPAMNALMSEFLNLINAAGLDYDCTKLTNLVDAVVPRIHRFSNNSQVNIPLAQNVWTAPPLGSPVTYGVPFGAMAGTLFTFSEGGVYEISGLSPVFNECKTSVAPPIQDNPWVAAGYAVNGAVAPNDAIAPGGSSAGQGIYYTAGKPAFIEVDVGDSVEFQVMVTNGENAAIWRAPWVGSPAIPSSLTIRKIR